MKVTKSFYLEQMLSKDIERLARILKISESKLMEDALGFYLEKSKVKKEALKNARQDVQYSEKVQSARKTLERESLSENVLTEVSMSGKKKSIY